MKNVTQHRLAGRVALITGGGRGIGRAVAIEFARQGAAVTVTARSAEGINDTAEYIRHCGGKALAVQADVTDSEAVRRVVETTTRELGPISILVNNAGISGPTGPVWQNGTTEWWRTLETHLHGTFLVTQAVVPGMIACGGGHVLTMASGAALKAQSYFSAYGIAKTAQVRLMETLAEEGHPHGIIAFAVSPGLIYTDLLKSIITDPNTQEWRPEYVARVIAERDHGDQASAIEHATKLCTTLASGYADLLSGGHFHPVHDLDAEIEKIRARQAP